MRESFFVVLSTQACGDSLQHPEQTKALDLTYFLVFVDRSFSSCVENDYLLSLAVFLLWNLIFSPGFFKYSSEFVCLYFYIYILICICGANRSLIYHKPFNFIYSFLVNMR